MMIAELLNSSEESSWAGTKEAARWNGVCSEPLADLDINRTPGDVNGTETVEIRGSTSQEKPQGGKLAFAIRESSAYIH